MHPGPAIACSIFEIISTAKSYLDVIVWSRLLLLCKHVSLLVLLSMSFHAKLLVNLLIFSAVAVSRYESFFVLHLSML